MTLVPHYGHAEPFARIMRRRVMSRPGEVLKRTGQSVGALDVVARSRVPQNHNIIDVARGLRVPVEQFERYVLKQPGEAIEKGEPIAARRTIAGLRRTMVRSPVDGEVVEVGGGLIILEGEPHVIEVRASVPGTIVDIIMPFGVVVETQGARLQLAWARGALVHSQLRKVDSDDDGQANPSSLYDMEHRSTIVAITAPLTADFLRSAAAVNVEALVGPSMQAELVPLAEELDLTLGLTEGFGHIPMAGALAAILNSNDGRQTSFDPGTDAGWRASRPEIIIPIPDDLPDVPPREPTAPLIPGNRVRLLRGPHRGAVGTVSTLPGGPRQLSSGLRLSGAEVKLGNGEIVFAPFANLEHLG